MTDTITITLDGKEHELKPTLKAAKTINGMSGGYMNVFRSLGNFDFETVTMVIAAGLNKKPGDIEQAVFDAGVKNLIPPVSDFITLLSNGGKMPSDDDAPKGSDEGNG